MRYTTSGGNFIPQLMFQPTTESRKLGSMSGTKGFSLVALNAPFLLKFWRNFGFKYHYFTDYEKMMHYQNTMASVLHNSPPVSALDGEHIKRTCCIGRYSIWKWNKRRNSGAWYLTFLFSAVYIYGRQLYNPGKKVFLGWISYMLLVFFQGEIFHLPNHPCWLLLHLLQFELIFSECEGPELCRATGTLHTTTDTLLTTNTAWWKTRAFLNSCFSHRCS